MLGWAIKQLFIWTAIGSVAFALLADKSGLDIPSVAWNDGTRNRGSSAERHETPSNGREMTIRASRDGHFRVVADVDGTRVDFLIDTGATGVALAADVADRLGWRLSDVDYTMASHTAGGMVRAAPVTLDQIEIGDLRVHNLNAHVVERLEGVSLLGMTFLNRLDGFEVRGDELTLYW